MMKKREAPKYDWKCAKCGMTYPQKTAHEVGYCGHCDHDEFYRRIFGDWSLLPVRMGANVEGRKSVAAFVLKAGLILFAAGLLAFLAAKGCPGVLAQAHEFAREIGGEGR